MIDIYLARFNLAVAKMTVVKCQTKHYKRNWMHVRNNISYSLRKHCNRTFTLYFV